MRHVWALSWKKQQRDCREGGGGGGCKGGGVDTVSGGPSPDEGLRAVPAEGLEQLRDHGGQFVQTEQGVLGRRRTSSWLGALHGVRVKAQRFEPVHAEM